VRGGTCKIPRFLYPPTGQLSNSRRIIDAGLLAPILLQTFNSSPNELASGLIRGSDFLIPDQALCCSLITEEARAKGSVELLLACNPRVPHGKPDDYGEQQNYPDCLIHALNIPRIQLEAKIDGMKSRWACEPKH